MRTNSEADESLTSSADLAFAESNGPWSRSASEMPEAIPEGLPEGIAQGLPEGIAQGLPEGIAQGMPEAMANGRALTRSWSATAAAL
jgi:flagellar biosynthesis/type III secretory pathway protein FliH